MVRALAVLLLSMVATAVAAGTYMVRDLDPTISPTDSSPRFLGTLGNVTLFRTIGVETYNLAAWSTDGTETGTRPLPFKSGLLAGIGTINGRVICYDRTGLYAWDGTSETFLAAVDSDSSSESLPQPGTVYRGFLYFSAARLDVGVELWRTDGTAAGTTILDVVPGPVDSYPISLVVFGDRLYFGARSPAPLGRAVYSTDGTANGTTVVRDQARLPFVAGTRLFYVVELQTGGSELWTVDGTGASLVRSFSVFSRFIGTIGNLVVFAANDGVTGRELWITNGTSAGTRLIADLVPGTGSSSVISLAGVARGLLFIRHSDGQTASLLVTDGTQEGTRKLKTVEVGSSFVFRDQLYFEGFDAASGRELWHSDGTVEGTQIVADLVPGSGHGLEAQLEVAPRFEVRENDFLFEARDATHGLELWRSDGTTAGTRMLKNIKPEEGHSGWPLHLQAVGNEVFFLSGGRVGHSNGTAGGTALVGPVTTNTGEVSSSGSLYFWRADLTQLWRSDGTEAGTFLLFDGLPPLTTIGMTPFRGGMLFIGAGTNGGREPWFSDGTVAGTKRIAETIPGPDGFDSYGTYSVAGNVAFYRASDSSLWRTDGTAAGTRQFVAPLDFDAGGLTLVGDILYFFGPFTSGVEGDRAELWRSDGTTAGTRLVKRLTFFPSAMVPFNGKLLLPGPELWISDGTESGTKQLAASIQFCPYAAAVVGSTFRWVASDGVWVSDGTAEGTRRIKEADFSVIWCDHFDLAVSGNRIFFQGFDLQSRLEPWVSDGTAEGTFRLADIEPDSYSSEPQEFTVAGSLVYFSATNKLWGRELWAFDERRGRQRAVRH